MARLHPGWRTGLLEYAPFINFSSKHRKIVEDVHDCYKEVLVFTACCMRNKKRVHVVSSSTNGPSRCIPTSTSFEFDKYSLVVEIC